MSTTLRIPILVLLAFCAVGCQQYSAVKEMRPDYRYQPVTPVGALILKALETKDTSPSGILAGYVDAAAEAARRLAVSPDDDSLRRDYNYAVGRVFEAIEDGKLDPWDKPLTVSGSSGSWVVDYQGDRSERRHPRNYRILPADRYTFKGTYVGQRMVKTGLGAPLVVSGRDLDFTKLDRFAQGKHIYYSVTGLISFQGRRATIRVQDPLSVEKVEFEGHRFPLAADFTAALGLALAMEDPKKLELARLLRPQKFAETARLARLQPYDPNKIPLICVHGLMDSPATWMPMINRLRNDPVIRQRYQVWFFSYPSGYPYPYSAALMREQMDAIFAAYPDHKKVVLIGHSMGGIISRTMITDSGTHIWDRIFPEPPEKLKVSSETKEILTKSLIFKHRPEVARVIFIAAPHRGSELASGWIGRIGTKLIQAPGFFLKVGQETMKVVTMDPGGMQLGRIPNSVDTLSPKSRIVRAIDELPLTPGVPFHSIMGDRGQGGNKSRTEPISSDGIVPYWSSHLDGAQSELLVPSGHSAHQNPQAIEEVIRILRLHVGVNGTRKGE